MKKLISVFVILTLVACSAPREEELSLRTALDNLDKVLLRQQDIQQMKESHIREIRSRHAAIPSDLYHKYDLLYEEYAKYDVDSALRYAHLKAAVAEEIGDQVLINDASLDFSFRYLLSGMYANAEESLKQVDTLVAAGAGQLPAYYQNQYNLWHGLAVTTKDKVLEERYHLKEKYFQHRSQEAQTGSEIDYYTISAGILMQNGETAQARRMLENRLKDPGLSMLEQSILHYWIAKTYQQGGNDDAALLHYVLSSELDSRIPIKEIRSPVKVAQILYEKGDIGRAYNYITRAYRDAIQADARICLNEIAELLPPITAVYERNEQKQKSRLVLLAVGMILLAGALIVILFMLHGNNRKLNRANQTVQNSLARLQEANNIKDSYLGRYLSMFSDHINSLEQYRSQIRVTAKSMDLQEIQKVLKSDTFISKERENLYQEFDSTFLGLFPNFVEQLNSLLEPDKRIGQDLPKGTLSNELRVFALIRLGVTESSKIARFLKKSPSTIYNYRVKLRNAAAGDRDTFEARLMQIGN